MRLSQQTIDQERWVGHEIVTCPLTASGISDSCNEPREPESTAKLPPALAFCSNLGIKEKVHINSYLQRLEDVKKTSGTNTLIEAVAADIVYLQRISGSQNYQGQNQ